MPHHTDRTSSRVFAVYTQGTNRTRSNTQHYTNKHSQHTPHPFRQVHLPWTRAQPLRPNRGAARGTKRSGCVRDGHDWSQSARLAKWWRSRANHHFSGDGALVDVTHAYLLGCILAHLGLSSSIQLAPIKLIVGGHQCAGSVYTRTQ